MSKHSSYRDASCWSCLPKGAGPSTKPSPPELHPTRTKAHRERVPPQAISGSEADGMSRGGYPVAGRLSSKSSSIGHIRSNEAALTRATTDTDRSAPGAGAPTGDFWKRSGQHEPRRVPAPGAPFIEAVFHQAQAFNEAVFCQALPVLFSRQTCPTSRRTPPHAAAAPAHPGSSAPPTARNRATAHP